ncbi:MAG: TetR/AcrR family transcriptional regulator C-terminal domain-containing protein [Lachnospiraceae bacterium]
MTHKEISYNTKKTLCDSLKKLMKHKPFSKITVSELIRDCNVNRKTFYYHFDNIYSLLKWWLEQEAIEVVKQFDLFTDYQDALLFAINYVEENSYFLNCIYDSVGREELKNFFYPDFNIIMDRIIRTAEKQTETTISDDFREFLCAFYTESLAGMMINLFQHPEKYEKERLINYCGITIHNSIQALILANGQKSTSFSQF